MSALLLMSALVIMDGVQKQLKLKLFVGIHPNF